MAASGGGWFGGSTPFGEVRGATMRGRRLAHKGVVGQDAAAARFTDERLVLAVADGVGNSRQPARASSTVTSVVAGLSVESLQLPARQLVDEIFHLAGRALSRTDVGETTMSVAVVEAHDQQVQATVAAVGDSPIMLFDEDSFQILVLDDLPEGRTRSVRLGAEPEVRAVPLLSGSCLMLMSDGVGSALQSEFYDGPRSFLTRAWAEPPELTAFPLQVDFRLETFSDDRSAVGLWVP